MVRQIWTGSENDVEREAMFVTFVAGTTVTSTTGDVRTKFALGNGLLVQVVIRTDTSASPLPV